MAPYTPVDIYVFVREVMYAELGQTVKKDLGEERASKLLIPIPDIQWDYQLPKATPYLLPNNTNRYKQYFYTGQWRLLVPYNIMHHLGYPYVLQLDDDLFIAKPFQTNALEYMRKNKLKMATHKIAFDNKYELEIMKGLPELGRFFLTSNNMQPGSSIMAHLRPGPRLDLMVSQETGNRKGYDLAILWGNLVIMSTDLCAKPKVQDWIALCMSSGGLERHRWQEQGVMAFIWLLFTNEEELWQLGLSMCMAEMQPVHAQCVVMMWWTLLLHGKSACFACKPVRASGKPKPGLSAAMQMLHDTATVEARYAACQGASWDCDRARTYSMAVLIAAGDSVITVQTEDTLYLIDHRCLLRPVHMQ